MPFRFSLEGVLRWRESLERRELLRLEMVTREVTRAQQGIERAKKERENAAAVFHKRLREGMNAAEMQFELATDATRRRQLNALGDHLSKLRDLHRRQMEVYHKAQQQRKIMENLRDRQLATYRLSLGRKHQQELDERFLLAKVRERQEA